MLAVVCAHVLVLAGRLLEPEVTTPEYESVVRRASLSFSPSLFLFFFFFIPLRSGNVTLYLLLHLVTAGDSCTYFWSTACLMQPPVCTACYLWHFQRDVRSFSQQSNTDSVAAHSHFSRFLCHSTHDGYKNALDSDFPFCFFLFCSVKLQIVVVVETVTV